MNTKLLQIENCMCQILPHGHILQQNRPQGATLFQFLANCSDRRNQTGCQFLAEWSRLPKAA